MLNYLGCTIALDSLKLKEAIINSLNIKHIVSDSTTANIFYHSMLSQIYFRKNSFQRSADEILLAIDNSHKAMTNEKSTIFSKEEYKFLYYIHQIKLIAISGYITHKSYWKDYYPNIEKNNKFLMVSKEAEMLLLAYSMQNLVMKRDYQAMLPKVRRCDELEDSVHNDIIARMAYILKAYYYNNTKQMPKAAIEMQKASTKTTTNIFQKYNLIRLNCKALFNQGEPYKAISLFDSLIIEKQNYVSKSDAEEITKLYDKYTSQSIEIENTNLILKTYSTLITIFTLLLISFTLSIFIIRKKNKKLKASSLELNQLISEIDILSRDNAKFLFDMGHELRTPLNSIIGFSNILLDDESISPIEQKRYSNIISDNSNSLLNILDDVIKENDTELTCNPIKIDLVSTAKNTLFSIEKSLPKKLKFIFKTEVEELYLTSDPFRLAQVISNLTTNSYKFTKEGEIILEITHDINYATIAISDTGSGVDENIKDNIFLRDVSGDSLSSGTGLGLAISKSIITHLGGEIYFDKDYTQGARFYFTIPIK